MAAKNTHTELLDVTVEYGAALRHREALYQRSVELKHELAQIEDQIIEADERVTQSLRGLNGFFMPPDGKWPVKL